MRAAPLLLALLTACAPPGPEGPHLLWSEDPQSLDNPLPDQRLIVAGAAQLRARWYEPFTAPSSLTPRFRHFFDGYAKVAPAQVKGFGNFGQTLLRGSEAVAPASLAGHFFRLRRAGDGWALLEANVAVEHVLDLLASKGATAPAGLPDSFMVRPSVPLPEGEEGLLVATKGLTTADGRALERGRAWDAKKGALAQVAAAVGVPESDVLLALPQVGVPVTAPLRALAAWAEANPVAATIPAKGLAADGSGQRPVGRWQDSDGDWSTMQGLLESRSFDRPAGAVGQVVIGELAARDLRDGGQLKPEWLADPAQAPVVPLAFVLTLPKGPRPPGGWKVVLGAHGAGGRNTPKLNVDPGYCLEWAQPLAARGLGCIGIDAVSHGTRGSVTQFFAVEDLAAIRDRFREMTFDLLQLERAVRTLDVDGDGAPDLQGEVGYFGNSLGGIMGSGFLPYANHVKAAVLNVPGAGLSNILVSNNIGGLIGLLIVAQTDLAFESAEYHAAFPLFRSVGQAFFETGDPINMVQLVPPGRAVLVQEGRNDQLVPNATTEDLAKALGAAPAAGATQGTAPLRVLQRVDPAWYLPPAQAAGFDGHEVLYAFDPVRAQALRFLESDGQDLLAVQP